MGDNPSGKVSGDKVISDGDNQIPIVDSL